MSGDEREEPGAGAPAPGAPGSGRSAIRAFWSRCKYLIAGFAAGITAAAVAAAIVVVVTRPPAARGPDYSRLPPACATVGAAAVTRYLPGATIKPQSWASSRTLRAGACNWSSSNRSEVRTLQVVIEIYNSPDGLSKAEHDYDNGIPVSCSCKFTVARRAVTGLGNQATAALITLLLSAGDTPPAWNAPQIALMVRSGNALVNLTYGVNAGPQPPPRPANATLLAATVAMARDVLAALAGHPRPAPPPAPPSSPAPATPRYAIPRHPCTLIKASTLARYAPGATVDHVSPAPSPAPGPGSTGSCYWLTPTANLPGEDYLLSLSISIDDTAEAALARFQLYVRITRQDGPGTTRSVQPVKGLGAQATAIYQIDANGRPVMTVNVWSGNAEVEMGFQDLTPVGPGLSRTRLLAATVAMARDVLAALPRA